MTFTYIAILGAVAGFTTFPGLPIGRVAAPSRALREFLDATAVGILVLLLWEVLSHAAEPVEESLVEAVAGTGSWATIARRGPRAGAGWCPRRTGR
jgi:zinc transporter, ZIP family